MPLFLRSTPGATRSGHSDEDAFCRIVVDTGLS
jgi:hypothetical protein